MPFDHGPSFAERAHLIGAFLLIFSIFALIKLVDECYASDGETLSIRMRMTAVNMVRVVLKTSLWIGGIVLLLATLYFAGPLVGTPLLHLLGYRE